MNKILIFGGTFDPLHNGHLDIATYTKNHFSFDEVWFLIAKKPRWKKGVSSKSDRLKMLKEALKDYPFFKICKHEIDKKANTVNYTIDTVKELMEIHKNKQFSYLIGLDQLEKLHNWKDIELLSKLVKFICVKRPNYEINLDNVKKFNVTLLDYSGPSISSTMIKENFNKNLLPFKVYDYIVNNQLYLEERIKSYMSNERYIHSISVAKLAKKIASKNKLDTKKAYLAGLLHDIAKELDFNEQLSIMNSYFKDLVNEPKETFHQYVGAYLAKKDFKIDDQEILSAISKHCTSHKEMSDLDKILYVSDKIEPTRGYDSKYMIDSCLDNINKGYDLVFKENMEYLKQTKL